MTITREKRLLLKSGMLYSADSTGSIFKASNRIDLRIRDGIITELSENLTQATDEELINLNGLTVMPGLTDLHAHLRDFDQSDVDDLKTSTRAAAAGGFTTVVAMANTVPPRDNLNALKDTLERIRKSACIEVLPVATVTKALAGSELTNMVELAEAGAVAFSDDGMPIMNMAVFRRALSYVILANSFIISHSEDKHLSGNGCMNESPQSLRLGLAGIPAAAEACAVAREIEVLRLAGGHLHFTHLSTAPSIALFRRAKADGLRVTADVTPHHLTLKDSDIVNYDANFKMNPPLRSSMDQEALLDAVAEGTIDAIATDHAPWTTYQKTRPFEHCALGILGFETAFPLTYEALVLSKRISLERLIELFTVGPCKILKRPIRPIAAGQEASLAIADLKENWTYDVDQSPSKSRNSPYHGRKLKSKIVLTLHKGAVVFREELRLASVLNL